MKTFIFILIISLASASLYCGDDVRCGKKCWYREIGWKCRSNFCENRLPPSNVFCEANILDENDRPIPRAWIDCVDGKSVLNEAKKAAWLEAKAIKDAEDIVKKQKKKAAKAKLKNADCSKLAKPLDSLCELMKDE